MSQRRSIRPLSAFIGISFSPAKFTAINCFRSAFSGQIKTESVGNITPGVAGGAVDFMRVTEYGVADLRGSSLTERTRRLISIADPQFREKLHHDGTSIF
jgi:hypothetical protein